MLVRDPRWARSTIDLRDAIVLRDGGLCRYCTGQPTVIEIDHVWPVARGGRTTMTNCVSACPSCNRNKGSRTDWQPVPLADMPTTGEPLEPFRTHPRRHRTKAQRRRAELARSADR
ncbi:HNH endonuclease [Nakamurella sp. PAMC28650]|jgi:hypothetical protein|uniref:HNH endonuclease n=1 Tax=Nakamurella sp. PAMC28650 TaxID=2762325 RepID=UPI00164DD816|nr:HNH endonuclease [Nakamurella sp. PAMC28650]QNK83309.1 HNH endonuclease [Nakamurella sp. PAMC28650]